MRILKTLNSILIVKLTTAQTLLLGYLGFILFGSILLMLPISSAGDETLSLVDAIFTSASSISGTGLIVVDTGGYFSLFGQFVVLILIQIGNVGYMLFFALAVLFLGGRLSILNKIIIKESISHHSKLDFMLFIKKVFKYTLVIEVVSAVLLTIFFVEHFPLGEAIKQGVFHSISSFCTAGFSLFSNNLIDFNEDYYFNFVIILTSYAGCIGFFVMYDISHFTKALFNKKKRYRLSTHSKIVLIVSLSISIFGIIFILLSESVIGPGNEGGTFLKSFFQSTSASFTVGFSSVDIGKLNHSSLLYIIFEMFIGASPSGTGGGIKTTVFALMVLSLLTYLRDRRHVNVLKRTIPLVTITRAFSIVMLAVIWIFISVMVLNLTEDKVFLHLLFEAASALGNGGMSTGITPDLSSVGKLVLSASMLIGRVGPLIVGYTFLAKRKKADYDYPDANILIV
jgi:trk system potassium uptake protein TrkH